MHRSRAPSIAPGTFFVAQSWAGCITNMPGFNLRQAQDVVNIVAATMGTLSGASNALGWSTVLIYLFGAAGSGYFLIAQSRRPAHL